jgi:hypothetical protein
MSWFETKEQRRKNRGEAGSNQRYEFMAGRERRRGVYVLLERKTHEVVARAENGCFGRLLELDRDTYDEFARGTRGAL